MSSCGHPYLFLVVRHLNKPLGRSSNAGGKKSVCVSKKDYIK